MEGMKRCLKEKNEALLARTREDGNKVVRKELRKIRGCVATEVVDYVFKEGYEFVLGTRKMPCFRATTVVVESHCLDLLTTRKALMLLRVPSSRLPESMIFQHNCSQQLSRRNSCF